MILVSCRHVMSALSTALATPGVSVRELHRQLGAGIGYLDQKVRFGHELKELITKNNCLYGPEKLIRI
jgi:hypothetical protein